MRTQERPASQGEDGKSLRVCVDAIPEDFVHQGLISSAARARLNKELEGVCFLSLARVQEMFSKTY